MEFLVPVLVPGLGAQLFRADKQTDRQTDMTKLIAAFRNFPDVPEIVQLDCVVYSINNVKLPIM